MNFPLPTCRAVPAVALLTLALLTSCGGPQKETLSAADAAEEAVISQHDSLMARTSQLYELKRRISSSQAPGGAPYVQSLEGANASMMNWMHQYQAPDSTASEAQRLAYFEQQRQQLEAVEARMRGTIDSARTFISSLPASQVGGGQQ